MKNFFLSILVCGLSLCLVSCTTSNLITSLDAVSVAASAAVTVTTALQASGQVDNNTATLVATYAQATNTAVQASIAELNSKDTNAQKISVVSATFATVAAPALGSNVNPQIVSSVQAIAASIVIFTQQLHSQNTVSVAKSLDKQQTPVSFKLSREDKSLLQKTQKRCLDTDLDINLLLAEVR